MSRIPRLGTLLLVSLLGILADPPGFCQSPFAAGPLTPEALRQYCSAQSSAVCTVDVEGQRTLALHGDWRLPLTWHLRFGHGSALHITGGVLRFGGGLVDAPATEPIFPDGGQVRDLAAARPEWFASRPSDVGALANPPQMDAPLPAAALTAAFGATEPWGTIYLQPRSYLSPFNGCEPGQLPYASPRTLVGAGRPTPDDPVRPTRLQGGTILVGGVMGTAPIRLAHLGVDAGPEVARTQLHGCQLPAAFIEQPQHSFVSGDRIEDVSVLTTGAANMHSVMIAGDEDAEVRGLWIWTLGGTHGLVMKSSHSTVDGLHCWGAVADCLIVKSDYVTDLEGRADHDRIAHVDIHPLEPDGYVGGIVVESRWDRVRDLDMEDISETRARLALSLLGSTWFRPRNISVRNWTAEGVQGMCLFSDRADALQVSDFRCALQPTAPAAVVLHGGHDTLLQRGTLLCAGTPSQCAAGHTDGVWNDALRTSMKNLTAEGPGGYLLRSTQPPPALGGDRAVGMDGRLSTRYVIPLTRRWQDALSQVKPDLRIAYTAVATRVMFRPRLYALLAALLVCVAAWEVLHPRRRRVRSRPFRRA